MLNSFGFAKVEVYTDNLKKVWAIRRKMKPEGVEERVVQRFTNTIEAMIVRGKDPVVIGQMLLKQVEDEKYEDAVGENTIDKFLKYAEIDVRPELNLDKKLNLIRRMVDSADL
jgi:hypothetical protein